MLEAPAEGRVALASRDLQEHVHRPADLFEGPIDALGPPTLGSLLMAAVVWLAKLAPTASLGRVAELILLILLGGAFYSAFILSLYRDRAREVLAALRKADG